MDVKLIKYPTDEDWREVYRRAVITVGKYGLMNPSADWKRRILSARHSPIRYMVYSFELDGVPTWVATHLVRHHEGFQPYVRSQRNDRQSEYDRNAARQDAPVSMIVDVNAEALMVLANKRLCAKAAKETRELVRMMCEEAAKATPIIDDFLVPMCVYHGNTCHEMNSCGRWN